MAGFSYLLFFFTVHLLLLSSAEEESKSNQNCPFSVRCGNLGQFAFPFTNQTRPECGLMVVDKCNETVQRIQLGKDGPSYNITNIDQDYSITLEDRVFQNLSNNRSCESLKNLTLPSSTFFSFEIQSNLTLIKCPRDLHRIPTNFNLSCHDSESVIYYNRPGDVLPSRPPDCSLIMLPVNPTQNTTRTESTDLFSMLTSVFTVRINILREVWNCPKCKGIWDKCQWDKCQSDRKTNKDGKRKLKLGLGIGIGGLVILSAILSTIFLHYRNKQKYASANLHSGNNSSGPSSKSNLEFGTVFFGLPVFSYSDLAEATDDFNREKELGDGGFGTVYYGKLRDGREVAVKRLYEHNFRRVEQFMNEVEILTRLRHKNLVTLYGCTSRYSHGLLLVYEYVPNGTVADHLHGDQAKPGLLTWPIRMNIAIETASALAYLHASDIIHRDVKTKNILLDSNFSVKVADFGLSRLFPIDVTHVSTAPQGTPGYVDPEYHQCYQLTDKSDVYSFGVVLIELISSMPAVDMTRHRHEINLANLAINQIQKCAFDELIDPCLGYQSDDEVKRMTTSVAELAFLCLQWDKEMRPSMVKVLEELKRIKSGESKFEKHKEKQEDNEGIMSSQPPPSPPYCDDDSLLKNIRLPPSPISVAEKWASSSSITTNASC